MFQMAAHVNKKDEERMIIMALLQWFLLIIQDATLQLIVVEPMFNFKTSIPVNVQRTFKQVIMDQ